jgi:hypothetical protein
MPKMASVHTVSVDEVLKFEEPVKAIKFTGKNAKYILQELGCRVFTYDNDEGRIEEERWFVDLNDFPFETEISIGDWVIRIPAVSCCIPIIRVCCGEWMEKMKREKKISQLAFSVQVEDKGE